MCKPKGKALPKISKDGYKKGMNLALQNASGFMREAETLLAAKRYGRSFVLTALALEEIGKVVFLAIAADPAWAHVPDKAVRGFWRNFTHHAAKMHFLLGFRWKDVLYVRLRKPSPADAAARYKKLIRAYMDVFDYLDLVDIENIEDLKLRCLYVDTDRRKRRFVPPATVPKRVAVAIITIGRSNLRDARRLRDTFRRSDVEKLSEAITVVTFKREMMEADLRQLQALETGTGNVLTTP